MLIRDDAPADELREIRRLRRFTLRACALGLVLAYALALPLKGHDLMPPHLTWAGLLIVLPLTFSWLAAPVLFLSWSRRYGPVWVIALSCIYAAVLFLLLIGERGWE